MEVVRYASRQPVLSANQKVVGYKLLFRTGVRNHFSDNSLGRQDRAAIDISSLSGLRVLCDNRLGFVTCGRDVLIDGFLTFLPSDSVVIEISEDVLPEPEVMKACANLKAAGFRIALSNFKINDHREPLISIANFINVDMRYVSREDAARIATLQAHSRMLAENVETWEEFAQAKDSGYRYFQGNFFRKPETVRTRKIPASHTACLKLLQLISRPELDHREVEEIIRPDAALNLRLLRYINSAAFGLRGEVRSLSQALALLGENEFRRWCRLVVLFESSHGRPSDLVLSALVRARFCELIGEQVDHGDADLFLLGLLSHMDAILDTPMGLLLADFPLIPEAKMLLFEHKGPLSPIFELLFAIEAGRWWSVIESCSRLEIREKDVAKAHQDAMEWAEAVCGNSCDR
jgi:EAL and modified HD-GYP domain-containing signal transduction protein